MPGFNVINETTNSTAAEDLVTYQIFDTLFCVAASLVAIPANIIVIVCLWGDPGSQTSGFNTYSISVAFTDFLVGSVLGPFRIFVTFWDPWRLGNLGCIVWKLVNCGLTSVSMLLFLALGYDRRRSLTDPLGYRSTFSKRRATRLSLLMWVLGFGIWMPFIIFKLYVGDRLDYCPSLVTITEYLDLIQLIIAYGLPISLLIGMNSALIYALLQPREIQTVGLKRPDATASPKQTTTTSAKDNCVELDAVSDDQIASTPSCSLFEGSDITDAGNKCRENICILTAVERIANTRNSPKVISEAAPNKPRKLNNFVSTGPIGNTAKKYSPSVNLRSRSIPARKVLLMIVTFLVCWLPIIICWIVNFVCSNCIPGPVVSILVDISYFQSAANPVILIILSRNIRSKVRSFFAVP